jgi:hypothetical protein
MARNHKQINKHTMKNVQTELKEFTFNIDQKIEMWTRSTKHITAETYEQAEQIIKDQMNEGSIYEDLDEYEFLYDTQRDLDIIEVLNQDGNIINK